ncbi:hypothetical protein SK128_020456 [Halocaridina rubra]|uniref:Nuclear pore complex protein Nup153 n=1 Tax=Halocaridina rubra TaxID=373956 RepID=A0AAN8WV34_HALRR
MLRTKKDVDRHVRDVLNKVRTEDERKLRGYNISRLYFNIGEYESARRYLSEFLSVRPKAVDAHRLLGQIFEGLNLKEKAVQAYKTSYELGEGQRDLVLKICELYCDVPCDHSVRQYWADEGDRLFPHHEKVIRLREAIITASNSESREELEKLYFDEIKANPLRVKLYTSLLQLYKHWEGREKDAYKYGCGIESRKAFPDSLEWYQTLCDTLETYQNTADVNEDAEFHVNYLSVLERLVYLTLASCTGTALLSQCTQTDVVALLHKFDQNLTISLKVVGEDSIFGQLMIGQLFLHMASILLQGTKKDALLEANVSSGALLFHACRFLPCESCHPSKSQTSQDQFWYKLSCHRLSQAYHVIHHMAKSETEKSQFLEKIKEKTGNKEAQENIYRAVFGSSGSSSMEASFFVNYDKFYLSATCLSYPELEQVKKWDSVVGSMYCSSLRDMVWLCLQQAPCNLREPQPYYTFTLFEGLQFATNKMNTGAAETLCHLDLLAFLVATVYCQNTLAKSTHGPTPASHPTVVTSVLNTNEQAEWWSAAYMLFTNKAHHRLNKLRLTLQRGLEVIRAIGNHGVDLVLMAHLAQCFTKWAQTAKNDGSTRSEVDALEERAKHYWDCVLTMCQKIARNPSTIIPRNRLFIVHSESFSPAEIEKVQEEGKYFVAMRLAHAGRKQEAIQALGNLKSPESSYERAMLYKEQAQALLLGSNEESITAELRSQYTSLLRQARDTLYLTLDRLRMPGVDRVHPLNAKLSQQLEDVERKLSSISSDADIQREEDTESLSDDSQSQRLDLSNGHAIACQPGRMFSTPVREIRNSTRIARQEARPSPERLDAQVRAITDIQEHTLRNMEEQNAALRSQNEALRKLCTSINEDFKENNALYRSIMEQNKAPSTEVFASLITEIKQIPNNFQDAFTSLLNEVKQMQSSIHHLESDVRSIARNVEVVVEILKTERKQPERTDAKLEEQVPVEIPPAAAAVVPPGLNSIFYYDQQQIPYNYRPSASFLRFPPFSPPSTLADQAYSLSSTVAQAAVISTLAQASGAVVTPTPSSASAVNKEAVPSPAAGISVAQGISQGNFNSLSWTVTPTLHATSVSSPDVVSSKEATSTPAHNYQIAMPITVSALTPPPGSTPGEQSSLSLPCSTAGLLANVPAPLYSAVTPDNSPLRGQSKVKSLSSATVLSPEGLATSAVGNREVSATHSSDAKDGSFIAESPEGGGQGSPNKTRDATDDEEHDPCPDYKPRIPLPEKVEVRTGEEDEQVLFEERAKLFRYVDKEWRERGTGVIKLLHNPAQGSVRVLMRRDQTHKVCANHLVLSSMDIQPMKNNDRAWMWAAQDYADEEIRPEKFCCRFKTVEIATAFKDAFRKAKEFAKMKEDSSDHQELQVVPRKADDQTGISGPKTLREMFKPAEGSWNCDTCLVNNKPDSDKCEACHSPNPNASNKDIDSTNETQSSPYATFKFSSTSAVTTTSASKPFSFTYTSMVTSSTSASTETTSSFSLSASDVISSTATNAVIPTSVTSTTPLAAASTGASGKGKFMFSGFSFFTPPSVQAEKNEEVAQKPMSEDKKKVFANFTFANIDSKSPVSSTFSFSTPASENKLAVGGIFSGTANTGHMVSFGSISAESTPTASIFKTTDVKSVRMNYLLVH